MPQRRPWCAVALHVSTIIIAAAGVLHAQDPFEIHVLEYEELRPGEVTFETHANYTAKAPSAANQVHLTYELTAGLTGGVSLGVMQLSGNRPGSPLESAGWRVVPHVYAPRSWHWPVDAGLVVEFSFQDSRGVELIPILEKRFGRVQFDLNPSFGHSLHGPGTSNGWSLGLAARAGFDAGKRFTPSLEYYSDWGRLPVFAAVPAQIHQILPGGDFRLAKNVIWSVGVGFGITPAADRFVYKSRLEVSFGGRTRP